MSQTPSPAASADSFPETTSDQWSDLVTAELRGASAESLFNRTREGYRLQPVYRAEDLPDGITQLPGAAPFLRGPLPVSEVPRAVSHVVLQRHVNDDLDALARAVQDDVEGGVNGLWLDLRASGIGSPAALGSVLQAIDVHALRRLALDGGSDGAGRLALVRTWLATAEIDPAQVALSLRLDPLGTLARDGVLPSTLDAAWDNLAQTVSLCRSELPVALPITLSAGPIHDAGGSLLHSIGWLLANAAELLRAMESRGLPPAHVAPRIELHLPLGRDVFGGIAAVRALRLTWSKLLMACGVPSPPPARIHADCSSTAAAAQDPWINALRTSGQVFAGVVAGADAITAAPWDAVLGLPDDSSRRLARNTHFVLGEEAHIGRIADPAGGSFHVEDLTAELARAGWAALRSIESQGGAAQALTWGWIAERLTSVWDERSEQIADGKEPILGVSRFPNPSEERPQRRAWPTVDLSNLSGLSITPLPVRNDSDAWTEATR